MPPPAARPSAERPAARRAHARAARRGGRDDPARAELFCDARRADELPGGGRTRLAHWQWRGGIGLRPKAKTLQAPRPVLDGARPAPPRRAHPSARARPLGPTLERQLNGASAELRPVLQAARSSACRSFVSSARLRAHFHKFMPEAFPKIKSIKFEGPKSKNP